MQNLWAQFRGSLAVEQTMLATELAAYLVIGGLLAVYVRLLYRWCGSTYSDADTVTRVFPMLTLVTAAVIAIVKTSLALSLGLVGALSIVRFRAAIKEPEELVYLFLCIAIGLAFGAEQPLLAVALVGVATFFAVGARLLGKRGDRQSVLLTITCDTARCIDGPDTISRLDQLVGRHLLQRLDIENGRTQIRLLLIGQRCRDTRPLLARLRSEFPDCEISYVDLAQSL